MEKERIRQAIRTGCERKDWSVMDLASRSQVSPEAIRRFISGRGEISTRVIVRLLQALGIDIKSLR
ncbi:MAG: helix-turn-helix transcriptional regulator [Planctomycetes bacterium]|nr:helix-turn-helix transcriptional regulator [Planctomycetota bacterium]